MPHDELILTVVIDGEPQPQGSVSAWVPTDKAGNPYRRPASPRNPRGAIIVNVTSDNAELKRWRTKIEASARAAFQRASDDGAGVGYTVEVVSFFCRPASHFGTGRNAARLKGSAPARPIVKPDVDKLLRAALDGIAEVVWAGDQQVTDTIARKRYLDGRDASPRQEIRVWRNAMQAVGVDTDAQIALV